MSAGELAPCLGIIEAPWLPINNQTSLTSNSGESTVLELGDSFWRIEHEINVATRETRDELSSFFLRRDLYAFSFTAFRPFRRRPRDPLITSDVGLTITAIDEANSTITMGGYGAGRKASFGDMISYRTPGNGYWVGQVVEEATADGSGDITITMWPRPRAFHATVGSRLPRRIDALGEFKFSEVPDLSNEGFKKQGPLKFVAEQVIR